MRTSGRVFSSIATLAGVVALIGPPRALAQNAGTVTADLAPTQPWQRSEAETIKELQRRLDERDAMIQDLLQRVQRLERREDTREGAAATAPRSAAIGAAPRSGARPTEAGPVQAQAAGPAAPAAQQPDPPQGQAKGAAAAKSAPGTFEVSEEAAQHALERALVQTGASLLAPGTFEFVPSLTYQFNERSVPAQVALAPDGTVLITENVNRSTQVEAGMLIRAGLPFNAQVEVGLPLEYKRLTSRSRVLGAGLNEQATNAEGIGDPTVTLTKQVFQEGDVWPGLFLTGSWNSNYGQTKKNVALGTGFNELSAGFTAVKRQDPLVFTAGFSYQTTFENHGVKPADQYTPAVSVLLAVSPETSLRFSQQVSYAGRTEFGGVPIPGSELRSGVFTFGMLSILGRGLVMDFSASLGETPDAPDLTVRVAFPIRLN